MTVQKQTPISATMDASAEQLLESARSIGALIQQHSDETERARRVATPVLQALSAAGFQSMLTPRSLRGLELDPITCARVVEQIAQFDSAAAWALQSTINAWWSSRLPDEGAEELYGVNPCTMTAAAFHPPQQATREADGFRISGRGPLASTIHDAEWILLSAFITEGGKPIMTPAGPEMIALILPASDITIIDTWYTLGMRGTDSNDVAFDNVFVPTRRTFPLKPEFEPGRHFQGPLYRFPGTAIIALFSAAVLMATARNAINEFKDLAQRKTPFGSMKTLRDREVVQATLADAEATLRGARALFYETFGEAWARTSSGQPNTIEHKGDLLLAGVHAARSSAKVTDMMHRLAGTTGIYTKSRLERYFRDAHTLRHQGFVSENKLQTVGQIYLGLPPDFPLVAF